jgi:hypothetical protein
MDGCPADAPRAVTRIRFFPAAGLAGRMVGGLFAGSNTSPTNDFTTMVTIQAAPTEGQWNEVAVAKPVLYRYVKYVGPNGSHGAVAELEFFNGSLRIAGQGFGTAGAMNDGTSTFDKALDGDVATAYEGKLENGNYVGIDLGGAHAAGLPRFSPAPGSFSTAQSVTIASDTAGAEIRYTTDGSVPSATNGMRAAGAVTINTGTVTVKAIAIARCRFESALASGTYSIGNNIPTRGQKSYHIGNSLTDTINPWLDPIADSSGVDHTYARWTIPGAPVGWLWGHKNSGFGTPENARDFDGFVRSFAPIDHVSVQPFASPSLADEAEAASKMLAAIRAASPNVQFWIYAQWPGTDDWQKDALATGAGWANPPWRVPTNPTNWETATANQLLYHEAFRKYVDDKHEGKPVLVVPAGPALVRLKQEIDAGRVPGAGAFFAQHFDDSLHLSDRGAYMVGLVFYACLYKQSPEGKVTFAGSGLTMEQARLYQKIAWDVAAAYPYGGIAPLP